MELPSKTRLSSGHGFYGLKLKYTKCFLGMNHHFTLISKTALLVAIAGVIQFVPLTTKYV